jgi:predicted DNA-binding transcriptional regulator AlpA
MARREQHLTQDDLKVLTLKEWARLTGVSFQTAKRLIAAGEGPRIIQLSTKRMGVRMIDAARWSEQRLRA